MEAQCKLVLPLWREAHGQRRRHSEKSGLDRRRRPPAFGAPFTPYTHKHKHAAADSRMGALPCYAPVLSSIDMYNNDGGQ
jgi:hypothetical protein